jgi:hypothetical protein
MSITTLATETDVRNAGNYSDRVAQGTLQFYLELTSFLMRDMITDTVYQTAYQGGTMSESNRARLIKAEALMTVGLSLPAVSAPTTQAGTLQSFNIGRTVDIQVKSIAKEIMEMAANFITLAKGIIPAGMITDEGQEDVWCTVYMRVFPSLSEMPTQADMHSTAEAAIQDARGDEDFVEEPTSPQG